MSERLDFVVRDGDQIPRLDAADWPASARISWYKFGILEATQVMVRSGDEVRISVANGSAVYRVIGDGDQGIMLLLVQGTLIWPGRPPSALA